MGMLKRMKDMKDMVEAAPGMVAQAQQIGAQAQQMAAAQQAAMQAQMGQFPGAQPGGMPGVAPAGPDFDAIAGVSLDQFVAVSKGVAAYNYDQSRLTDIAAAHGIDSFTWEQAARGWNDRIRSNPAVAQRFNQLYRAG